MKNFRGRNCVQNISSKDSYNKFNSLLVTDLMIVTDNYIDCCDALYFIRDGSHSANLGSGIRQCLTYGTLTRKHECADGRSSRAFNDDE